MAKNDVDVRLRLLGAQRFQRDAKGAGDSIAGIGRSGHRTKGGLAAAARGMARFGAIGVTGAVAVGKALYDVGAKFDDASDTIRVGTGKTGAALKGLEADFGSVIGTVPTDFGSASTAIANLNTRLGLTGGALRARSAQFLELSRITKTDVGANIEAVTEAFNDWDVKTNQQSNSLDKFFRASQASGATVGDLAKNVKAFGAPLRQVGFSLDEATAMFATFERAGVNTQTMMPGLKFAVKSFLKEGIDPRQGLKKTLDGIQSGTISATKAFEIFGGRATPDMIEAIKQGRFSLGEMEKALRSGDTIRKAGIDTRDLAEQWVLFRNDGLKKIAPVAKRVFDGLGRFMQQMRTGKGTGGEFVRVVKSIWREMEPIVVWVGKAAAATARFGRKHPTVAKLALSIVGVGLALKGLKFLSAATGFTSVLKAGKVAAKGLKRILGRGGVAAGEAAAANTAASMATQMPPSLNSRKGRYASAFKRAGKFAGRAFGLAAAAGIAVLVGNKLLELSDKANLLGGEKGRKKRGNWIDRNIPGMGAARDLGRKWGLERATGGLIPGTGSRDSVRAMLTPGEFVVRKRVVQHYGPTFFSHLNSGRPPVEPMPIGRTAMGGTSPTGSSGGGELTHHRTEIPLVVDGKVLSRVTLKHFGTALARA